MNNWSNNFFCIRDQILGWYWPDNWQILIVKWNVLHFKDLNRLMDRKTIILGTEAGFWISFVCWSQHWAVLSVIMLSVQHQKFIKKLILKLKNITKKILMLISYSNGFRKRNSLFKTISKFDYLISKSTFRAWMHQKSFRNR